MLVNVGMYDINDKLLSPLLVVLIDKCINEHS